MKKIFLTLAFFAMSSAMLYTYSGAIEALNQGLIVILKVSGIVLLIFYALLYIVVRVVAVSWGKKIAKEKAEQNQEEIDNKKMMVWSLGSGIAGSFVVFIINGVFGSILDQQATGIDLVAGNKYFINIIIGIISNPDILLDFLLQK